MGAAFVPTTKREVESCVVLLGTDLPAPTCSYLLRPANVNALLLYGT